MYQPLYFTAKPSSSSSSSLTSENYDYTVPDDHIYKEVAQQKYDSKLDHVFTTQIGPCSRQMIKEFYQDLRAGFNPNPLIPIGVQRIDKRFICYANRPHMLHFEHSCKVPATIDFHISSIPEDLSHFQSDPLKDTKDPIYHIAVNNTGNQLVTTRHHDKRGWTNLVANYGGSPMMILFNKPNQGVRVHYRMYTKPDLDYPDFSLMNSISGYFDVDVVDSRIPTHIHNIELVTRIKHKMRHGLTAPVTFPDSIDLPTHKYETPHIDRRRWTSFCRTIRQWASFPYQRPKIAESGFLMDFYGWSTRELLNHAPSAAASIAVLIDHRHYDLTPYFLDNYIKCCGVNGFQLAEPSTILLDFTKHAFNPCPRNKNYRPYNRPMRCHFSPHVGAPTSYSAVRNALHSLNYSIHFEDDQPFSIMVPVPAQAPPPVVQPKPLEQPEQDWDEAIQANSNSSSQPLEHPENDWDDVLREFTKSPNINPTPRPSIMRKDPKNYWLVVEPNPDQPGSQDSTESGATPKRPLSKRALRQKKRRILKKARTAIELADDILRRTSEAPQEASEPQDTSSNAGQPKRPATPTPDVPDVLITHCTPSSSYPSIKLDTTADINSPTMILILDQLKAKWGCPYKAIATADPNIKICFPIHEYEDIDALDIPDSLNKSDSATAASSSAASAPKFRLRPPQDRQPELPPQSASPSSVVYANFNTYKHNAKFYGPPWSKRKPTMKPYVPPTSTSSLKNWRKSKSPPTTSL